MKDFSIRKSVNIEEKYKNKSKILNIKKLWFMITYFVYLVNQYINRPWSHHLTSWDIELHNNWLLKITISLEIRCLICIENDVCLRDTKFV
jgi:hypothetical protein